VGETALITGASSGIGREFAKQLAARGSDLILVARREDRLRELAESLDTTAHIVPCDLVHDAHKVQGNVSKLGVDVDLLINNAGFGLRGRFLDAPEGRDVEMVRVNCEAVVVLTRAFLPRMIERGRGGVITVASSAGLQPLPYETTYSATKAFATNFTEALHMELRGTGVKALAVNPGPVPTEWQQVARYDEMGGEMFPGAIRADQVVREALRAYDRGKRAVVPGRFIRGVTRMNRLPPRALQLRVTERAYRPKRRDG
jgi:uncharacterized protein